MDSLMAHCRCELFHEAWKVLLDKDFIHAYMHGAVMDCADGIKRRIYPRIFTCSADYPESKITLYKIVLHANISLQSSYCYHM
jgi:hypothetical protein